MYLPRYPMIISFLYPLLDFIFCIHRVELFIKTFIRTFAGIDSSTHHRLSRDVHALTPKN